MLLADGLLLSQIACMLWFNELCLMCLLAYMPVWLLALNAFMLGDVIDFETEPTFKSTFVRLIGSHSTCFLVLVFALTVSLCASVDAITVNSAHLLVLLYVPFAIFVVNELMEEQTSKRWMHVAVLLGSCCFVVVYL